MGAKNDYNQVINRLDLISNNSLTCSMQRDDKFTLDSKYTFTHSCGYSYLATLKRVLNGQCDICSKCSGKRVVHSSADIQEYLSNIDASLVNPDSFKNLRQRLDIKFKCGCIESRLIGSFYKSQYYPICSVCEKKASTKLNLDEVSAKMKSFRYGSFTLLSDSYNGYKSVVKYKCDSCNMENEEQFGVLYNRDGKCKFCFSSYNSIQECYVNMILKDMKINFLSQFKIDTYLYDFLLTDYKIIIEIDGKQHETELFNGVPCVNNDLLKDNLALKNGYKIYRISYKDNVLLSLLKILQLFNDYPFGEYTQVSGNAKHLNNEMKI